MKFLEIILNDEKVYNDKTIHLKQIMRIARGILDRKWQIVLLSFFNFFI